MPKKELSARKTTLSQAEISYETLYPVYVKSGMGCVVAEWDSFTAQMLAKRDSAKIDL